MWKVRTKNAWLQYCRVECLNTGACIVVISPLVSPETGSTYPRFALEIFHSDGRHYQLPWRSFLKEIVETQPRTSAEERYHWLRSVDALDDTHLRVTNARGSTMAVELATGNIRRIAYGPDEKRDPFDEPDAGKGGK